MDYRSTSLRFRDRWSVNVPGQKEGNRIFQMSKSAQVSGVATGEGGGHDGIGLRPRSSPREQGSGLSLRCPVCVSEDSQLFYRVDSVPVTTASLLPTAEDAESVMRGAIQLAVCQRCALVFNAAFDPELGWTAAIYETSQAASPHFSSYARSLAASWVQRYGLEGKTVLEVGCGSGEFLGELLRAGVGKAIGIDPLVTKQSTVHESNGRLELIPSELHEQHADLESSALVCRHTLEHIADVRGFLQLVAEWARCRPGRAVLFEVPASERIFAECAFWDVYYEHSNYFTKDSLKYAFEECGLQVMRLEHSYGKEYLLLEAVAMKRSEAASAPSEVAQSLSSALEFGDRVGRRIEMARRNMHALADLGPLVIWQGAAKAVGFLTTLGEPALIKYAIDANQRRHGFYLPGLVTKVVPPDTVHSLHPRHVVLMNPTYLAEVNSTLRELDSGARLFTVNEVCDEL
jgi:SAM-dependent methyltransferase